MNDPILVAIDGQIAALQTLRAQRVAMLGPSPVPARGRVSGKVAGAAAVVDRLKAIAQHAKLGTSPTTRV